MARVSTGQGWVIPIGLCWALGTAPAWADGTITGHGRFEKVKGQPQLGYVELYEANLYVSPPDQSLVGPHVRLGASGGTITGDGFFSVEVPAGTYSLLVAQPAFFYRPKVVDQVVVTEGQTTTVNVELNIDFSTYVKNDFTDGDNDFYQTFVATGRAITGVSFILGSASATDIEVSIREENGGDVTGWPVVGSRMVEGVGVLADNFVKWRDAEVPTTPGHTYAVHLSGNGSYQVCKRDKDGDSYASGRAYRGLGQAQDYDLSLVVYSDNDGTQVTLADRSPGLGRQGDWSGRSGQTFRARGTSLAGVDLVAATGATWDVDFYWTVRRGGPTGDPVGPSKATRAGYQAAAIGIHGVSYGPGEVPLVPGDIYYIEASGSPGLSPFILDDDDGLAEGMAYQDGGERPTIDLSMTILEYVAPPGPDDGAPSDGGGADDGLGPEGDGDAGAGASDLDLGDGSSSPGGGVAGSGCDCASAAGARVGWLGILLWGAVWRRRRARSMAAR